MRKGEFKLKAERAYVKRYGRSVEDYGFYYHSAHQYRWQETPDPIILDETYHLTEKEAMEAASNIKLEIGFSAVVYKHFILYDDFNLEFEFGQEFELKELFYEEKDCVFESDTYQGKDITGSIIIRWSWEKYTGYCRNLKEIGIAGEYPFYDFKMESDLITGNEESTFRPNFSVLLTKEEIDGVSGDDLYHLIDEELSNGWKWNSFKDNRASSHIKESILEICKTKTT